MSRSLFRDAVRQAASAGLSASATLDYALTAQRLFADNKFDPSDKYDPDDDKQSYAGMPSGHLGRGEAPTVEITNERPWLGRLFRKDAAPAYTTARRDEREYKRGGTPAENKPAFAPGVAAKGQQQRMRVELRKQSDIPWAIRDAARGTPTKLRRLAGVGQDAFEGTGMPPRRETTPTEKSGNGFAGTPKPSYTPPVPATRDVSSMEEAMRNAQPRKAKVAPAKPKPVAAAEAKPASPAHPNVHLERIRQHVHELRKIAQTGFYKNKPLSATQHAEVHAAFRKHRAKYQEIAGNTAEHIPDVATAEKATRVSAPNTSGRYGKKQPRRV